MGEREKDLGMNQPKVDSVDLSASIEKLIEGGVRPRDTLLTYWLGKASALEREVDELREARRLGLAENISIKAQLRQLIRILPGREEQDKKAREVLEFFFSEEKAIIHKDFKAVEARAKRAEDIVTAAKEYIRAKCFDGQNPNKCSEACADYAHCQLKHLCAIVRAEGRQP